MVQEWPVRVERRLAAILAADVAGYSRLMHNDEEATHAKLRLLLADGVMPAISEHGGRIVKNTGDGFLAEFPSAVGAVRAALQFQTRVKELTADMEDRRIAFRVGINVGDVIVEPHDIFGDGVNIAARLESISEPGGICVSSSAYDQIYGKIGIQFADLGDQNLKNIDRPVRVYAALSGLGPAHEGVVPGRLSPPRLSIIVLPFANLSQDPTQDYFVDGMTDSLTTDLSRIRGAFVIGRHTAFTYKGEAHDVKKIGRELNVRYVLEGSVQRSANRIRVNVQLLDAETAGHLWAERFDKPVADLFDMQDEIVSRIGNALNAQLTAVEARRAARKLHPDAMDLMFLGWASFNREPSLENMTQARIFFERALALDPENVEAQVVATAVDLSIGSNFLTDDWTGRFAAAEKAVNKVLTVVPDFSLAHLALGGIYILTNRATEGIAACERAVALDRNLAMAHGQIGVAKIYIGRPSETEAHIQEALRLSPRDIFAHRWMMFLGHAKLYLGADAEAAAWLRKSMEASRNISYAHFALAAPLAHLGRLEEAQAATKTGLGSIRRLPSVEYATEHRATIRTFSPRASGSIRECAWRECRRANVHYWSAGDPE